MQVKKQQLEPNMEQWTGSKLGKEYVKAVCCHPACLTYMQSTLCSWTTRKRWWVSRYRIHRQHRRASAVQKTQRSNLEDPLEEEMATHSSILAWKIPWTEETGGLQSMGSQRVRHDWSNWAHTYTRALTNKSYQSKQEGEMTNNQIASINGIGSETRALAFLKAGYLLNIMPFVNI